MSRGVPTNPKQVAQVVIAMAEPDSKRLDKAIKNAGLPKRTAAAIRARYREMYPDVLNILEDLSKDSFVRAIQQLRRAALGAITFEKMEKASASQLTWIASVLQDKQALLEGDPTSIVRFEDLRIIGKLAPMLVKEFERRGITYMDAKPEGEAKTGEPSYAEVESP